MRELNEKREDKFKFAISIKEPNKDKYVVSILQQWVNKPC